VAVSEKLAPSLFGSGLGLGLSQLLVQYGHNRTAFFAFLSLSVVSAFGVYRHFLFLVERRENLESSIRLLEVSNGIDKLKERVNANVN
jgi:hypothetical protein